MKVKYKATVDNVGAVLRFSQQSFSGCCKEATDCIESDFFAFGDEAYNYCSAKVFVRERTMGYYGDCDSDWHKIEFCPFCGVKIDCEEILRIKVVEKSRQVKELVTREVCDRHEEVIWRKE